jgi:hypothetical protein
VQKAETRLVLNRERHEAAPGVDIHPGLVVQEEVGRNANSTRAQHA